MEQRPLRLGDLVDDYCPRERRITNHAIVAIVDDAIRQTRCIACEAEHLFKGGKLPRRRLVKPSAAEPAGSTERTDADAASPVQATMDTNGNGHSHSVIAAGPDEGQNGSEETGDGSETDDREHEAWPANRQLIRATLPRIEGELPPPRPI